MPDASNWPPAKVSQPGDWEPKPLESGRAPLQTSWVWLLAALPLLLVANGRDNVPLAAWLAPVFLLRFLRGGSGWRLPAAAGLLVAAWGFQFRGMVPAPQPVLSAIWVAYGLVLLLPYLVDCLLWRRLRGFTSTLAFPCAAAGVEYLLSLLPYGSWGSAAYTQYGHLALMQLASVTGIYGITFLMAWCASVVNWAWQENFSLPRIRRGMVAYAAVLAGVLIVGSVRLISVPPGPTVRVASLTRPDLPRFPSEEIARHFENGELSQDDIGQIRPYSRMMDENLLRRAAREADAGARIVFWGEGNSYVLAPDEPWLMNRASEMARAKGIYLGLGNVVWHYQQPRPLENSFVLFDPSGKKDWKFLKAHPVPGGEASISMSGDGRLPFTESPFGRLSAVICFDADSVQLLQQAGRGGADLVLIPSNDWEAIDPWHTRMAVFRAVEQGFNMVRHASGGLSIATDYQGRVLAAMDHYQTRGDRALVAEVPIHGVRTLYSLLGDLFSWLCLAGLAVLLVAAVRRGNSGRSR